MTRAYYAVVHETSREGLMHYAIGQRVLVLDDRREGIVTGRGERRRDKVECPVIVRFADDQTGEFWPFELRDLTVASLVHRRLYNYREA